MNHIAYLKRIRFLHHLLLLCAILLTVLGSIMGGVGILLFSFIVVWIYHRCPKCGGEIDTLLTLDKTSCCPACGCFLMDGTGGTDIAEAAEGAEEAEPEKGVFVDKAV